MRARKSGAKGGARRGATPVEAEPALSECLDPLLTLAADYYWEQDTEHRFTIWRSLRADVSPPPDAADWLGWTSGELCVAPAGDLDSGRGIERSSRPASRFATFYTRCRDVPTFTT